MDVMYTQAGDEALDEVLSRYLQGFFSKSQVEDILKAIVTEVTSMGVGKTNPTKHDEDQWTGFSEASDTAVRDTVYSILMDHATDN